MKDDGLVEDWGEFFTDLLVCSQQVIGLARVVETFSSAELGPDGITKLLWQMGKRWHVFLKQARYDQDVLEAIKTERLLFWDGGSDFHLISP